MEPDISNFLKYLDGEPLTEELAKLRAGDLEEEEIPGAEYTAPPTIRAMDRELLRKERQELREILRGPGWPVVLRVQEKLRQMHRNCAMSISQDDPLKNRDKIAEQWAYVLMFNRAMHEFNVLLEAQVAEVEKKGEAE
jgi:hypothetical protein